MTLKEIREGFESKSSIASFMNRVMYIVAFILCSNTDNPLGMKLCIIACIFDLLQYFISSLVLGSVYTISNKNVLYTEDYEAKYNVKYNESYNIPSWILYILKILLTIIAYITLL
jgi:hypothetical protein